MTEKQPEALRLADALDDWAFTYSSNKGMEELLTKPAAELRRLHAENEMFRVMHQSHADKLKAAGAINAQLLEALVGLKKHFPTDGDLHEAGWDQADIDEACTAYDEARSAIAAAKREA